MIFLSSHENLSSVEGRYWGRYIIFPPFRKVQGFRLVYSMTPARLILLSLILSQKVSVRGFSVFISTQTTPMDSIFFRFPQYVPARDGRRFKKTGEGAVDITA